MLLRNDKFTCFPGTSNQWNWNASLTPKNNNPKTPHIPFRVQPISLADNQTTLLHYLELTLTQDECCLQTVAFLISTLSRCNGRCSYFFQEANGFLWPAPAGLSAWGKSRRGNWECFCLPLFPVQLPIHASHQENSDGFQLMWNSIQFNSIYITKSQQQWPRGALYIKI